MRLLVVGVVLGLTACATGAPSASTASVVVTSIAPPAGIEVQSSTVVEATVQFTIDKFKLKGDTYYLLTRFAAAGGGWVESEADRHLGDHPILTAAKGSVVVTDPLEKVWGNARLKKPIEMTFCLMERTGPNDWVVIGCSAPTAYAAK